MLDVCSLSGGAQSQERDRETFQGLEPDLRNLE